MLVPLQMFLAHGKAWRHIGHTLLALSENLEDVPVCLSPLHRTRIDVVIWHGVVEQVTMELTKIRRGSFPASGSPSRPGQTFPNRSPADTGVHRHPEIVRRINGFDKPERPLRYSGMAHLSGPEIVISADSGLGSRSTVGRPPLIVVIDCSLATRNRRRGWGDVGNLEGSTGPRRVVQSLWSGAAAAVHRLASPRPVSGRVRSDDRDGVADDVHVVVKMRPSPAAGRPKRHRVGERRGVRWSCIAPRRPVSALPPPNRT